MKEAANKGKEPPRIYEYSSIIRQIELKKLMNGQINSIRLSTNNKLKILW